MQAVGFFVSFTTTGAGEGGGTTTVSTAITKYDDAKKRDKWLLLTSGDNDTESHRVTASSGSTLSTLAFTNQVATSVTAELMEWDPDFVDYAIAEGLRSVYPQLYLPIRDHSIFVDDHLANSGFETFAAGVFANWTASGSPTITQETSLMFEGSSAAQIASGGSVGQLYQQPNLNPQAIVGKTVRFVRWVSAIAADTARIRIDWNGTDFVNSSFHSGDMAASNNVRDWVKLVASGPVPANAQYIRGICEVVANGVGQFDGPGGLLIPTLPITRYTIPTTIVGLARVEQQVRESEPDGNFVALGNGHAPVSGRILRLIGKGQLTVPATDSDTTEMDDNQLEALVARCAARLFRAEARRDSGNRDMHLEDERTWEERYQELIRRPGYRTPRMASYPIAQEQDSSGRYFSLPRARG